MKMSDIYKDDSNFNYFLYPHYYYQSREGLDRHTEFHLLYPRNENNKYNKILVSKDVMIENNIFSGKNMLDMLIFFIKNGLDDIPLGLFLHYNCVFGISKENNSCLTNDLEDGIIKLDYFCNKTIDEKMIHFFSKNKKNNFDYQDYIADYIREYIAETPQYGDYSKVLYII